MVKSSIHYILLWSLAVARSEDHYILCMIYLFLFIAVSPTSVSQHSNPFPQHPLVAMENLLCPKVWGTKHRFAPLFVTMPSQNAWFVKNKAERSVGETRKDESGISLKLFDVVGWSSSCRCSTLTVTTIICIFIRQKGSRNKWKKHQTHNNNNKTQKPLSKRANYSEQCYHIYIRTNSKKTSINQR